MRPAPGIFARSSEMGPRGRRSVAFGAMQIVVNGEARDVADGTTIESLLAALAIDRRRIAVERNREIVPRAEHAATPLAPGDRIEIVTMVGGG
jgi:sulfur carrier protein